MSEKIQHTEKISTPMREKEKKQIHSVEKQNKDRE